MSYWYDFEGEVFKIEPPVTGELLEKWSQDNDNRSTYWVITEDGQYIDREEHIGGNNSDFEEELQTICDELKEAGHKVNGMSAYCGEEPLYSWVGVVTIVDNVVEDHEIGQLCEVLRDR